MLEWARYPAARRLQTGIFPPMSSPEMPAPTGPAPLNVLVVYYYRAYPLRSSVRDHLYSFRRHGQGRVAYLNLATSGVPADVASVPFDVVLFHTSFLSTRWTPGLLPDLMDQAAPLAALPAVKVALPQDEFIHTSIVEEFIHRFDVRHVVTIARPSLWPVIYPSVDQARVQFHESLTGYLEDDTVATIARFSSTSRRPVDIGYRAWRAEPSLGSRAYLKTRIADLCAARAPAFGLSTDISTRAEDTILGDRWYRFLAGCKYTIGVESGAGILDRDGSIRDRTNAYVAAHPGASFEEIERACFPGLDGTLPLFALSPRHLEAAATRTCQVLVRGHYNGALDADRHYIALDEDFGNLDAVLCAVADDRLRGDITDRAYADIVSSGKYSYRAFAQWVLSLAAADVVTPRSPLSDAIMGRFDREEKRGWSSLAFRARVTLPITSAVNATARLLLPRPVRMLIHAAIGSVRGTPTAR